MAELVRLMSDYTVECPAWDATGNVTADHLSLSDGLAHDLQDWQQLFEDHFHHDRGWDDQHQATSYRYGAAGLAKRLQAELGTNYEVVVDLVAGRAVVARWSLGRRSGCTR